ncbi:MAG TPA: PstS family phosphate ABC transporter substrate-binding protein [Geminicoccaceae bacterium]|nr:PstS family phosphate ABC transporter substrate-binding protein [Geminicoccaceae bacterium]
MKHPMAAVALISSVGALGFVHGAAHAAETVRIDGSSTVYPVTEAVAEEFQAARRGEVRVTVGISGTGGGFKKFCRGETDISNASRPILRSEMEACRAAGIGFIELPVAFDALAVVVNPANDWVDTMTVDELKTIWEPEAQGVVMRWNQVRPDWPDQELTLYGAGADSGTFDYFTEAVVGKAKASRGDFTASEDDNILVQGVSGDRSALGFFGFAYVHENPGKLKTVKIVNPDGEAVEPSMEHVMDGSYNPLSRPLFLYVSTQALERPEVQEFVQFYLAEGAALAEEVGYTPLPGEAYRLVRERLENKATGTVFGGEPEVGLRIEELLERELKS